MLAAMMWIVVIPFTFLIIDLILLVMLKAIVSVLVD